MTAAGDHLTRLAFSIYENPGVYALLLGSGLSRSAGIPTGWEITLDLVRRVATADGVEEQPDWAQWYLEATGEEPDYSKLIGELGLARYERRSILHSYIEPTDADQEEGRKLPTAAHFAVADMVRDGFIRVIITTNFDRLLENALRDRGVEPTVVASVDALEGAEPLTHTRCFVLKLHGDYKDARILNTDAELSGYPPAYNALLDRILDEHGLIVCGWSGEWDHALRSAVIRSKSRRYSMFWASRGTPGDGATELIAHRDSRIIPITDADSFMTRVRDRVQTLQRTHRQEPRSTELLVASVKRYLARPEYRIRLDDLFASETELFFSKLATPGYTNHSNFSPEEFRKRVAFFEATTEPLSRMFVVLGRWGVGEEAALVADVIRSVCADADRDGAGFVPWINLRAYPAVLLLTAYGIGLARAERWDALHSILTTSVRRRNREDDQRMVDRLFLGAWPGGDNQIWQNIEGFDRRKTALSDHLAELFPAWARGGLGVLSDFDELYETWEVLASLVYLERHSTEAIEAVVSDDDRRNFEWMPVGRSGWHRETRERILSRIESQPLRSDLLRASISRGDGKFLELSLANFHRISGRIQW